MYNEITYRKIYCTHSYMIKFYIKQLFLSLEVRLYYYYDHDIYSEKE